MRRYYSIVAFAALLIFAPGAFADSMTFTDPGSNIWYNSSLSVYVNPYTANDNGKVLTLYCDDWNTDFSGNPSWDAVIAPLVPSPGPATPVDAANYAEANFMFGGITSAYDFTLDSPNHITATEVDFTVASAIAYYRYLEVAYLFGQIQNATDAITKQQLSAAAWTLFVDGDHFTQLVNAINSSGYGTAVVGDLAAAADAAGSPALPNYSVGAAWYVAKPVRGGSGDLYPMQEFMYDPPPVPEPASILLLGIVLVGCGRGLARRWS